MLRRFTSTAAAFLMLIAMTRVADRVDDDLTSALFYGFFVLEFGLLLLGVTGTERGYFGPRHHPVNRMFLNFSWVGIAGGVVTMVVQGTGGGNPLWLGVVGGTSMFTCGMACAVLAVSASPWRDLLYSRRFDDDRPVRETWDTGDAWDARGAWSAGDARDTGDVAPVPPVSDPVPFRDDAVHGVPRKEP